MAVTIGEGDQAVATGHIAIDFLRQLRYQLIMVIFDLCRIKGPRFRLVQQIGRTSKKTRNQQLLNNRIVQARLQELFVFRVVEDVDSVA